MTFIAIVVTVVVAGLVTALQLREDASAQRNFCLIVSAALTGAVASGLAIAFAASGRWGNWEDNMPWILGVASFALLVRLLRARGSELVIVWWTEVLSFLTLYGWWENGPGDTGIGALLTLIMAVGATVVLAVLIGAVAVVQASRQ